MAKKNGKAKYITSTGQIVPGVTTIIGNNLGWNKNMLIAWSRREAMKGNDPEAIKDESADIGTIAHYLCECDAKGKTPELGQYAPDNVDIAKRCFNGYLEWKKLYDIKEIQSEMALVSNKYGYGGTIDMLFKLEDKLILGDIKTSNDIYVEHKIQVAAYKELLTENNYAVNDIYILHFNKKNAGFSFHRISDTSKYWEIFKYCLALNKLKDIT
jgi:hypothetical protein